MSLSSQFLEKPLSQEKENSCLVDQIISLCCFVSMSKLKVNNKGNFEHGFSNCAFFRNGVVGDWKNCSTAYMAFKLDQITEENFRGTGLFL